MRTGTGFVLLIALVGAGSVVALRFDAQRDPDRRPAAETSRLRTWARTEAGAGISVLPKRIPAAGRSALDRVDHLPGFHEYAMRCSSCHVLPDPGAYTAAEWPARVDEMRFHIGRAGVLPPPDGELVMVRAFLARASGTLRK